MDKELVEKVATLIAENAVTPYQGANKLIPIIAEEIKRELELLSPTITVGQDILDHIPNCPIEPYSYYPVIKLVDWQDFWAKHLGEV